MSANPFAPVLNRIRKTLGFSSTAQVGDGLLLERFVLAADESAFALLVDRYGPMVWGTCRRVTGDAHAAEDAFQATWLVLARKASSLKGGGSLPGWLHRVAFHLALAARARPVLPLENVTAQTPGPEDEAANREVCRVIDEEVNRLPEKYRLPVLLCFFEGRTHAEAAAEMGWPVGTVAGRLARAKDLLHTRLMRRGLAPSVFPLPALAGAMPIAAGEATSGAAAALAAAFFAAETRRRLLVWALVVVLPSLTCLVAFGLTRGAPAPVKPLESPVAPEPPPPIARRIPRNRMTHNNTVNSVAFSLNGKMLASASRDRSIKFWDVATNKELATLKGHVDGVSSVCFSPDGKTLASASDDGTVKCWDVTTATEIHTFKGHRGRVRSVAFGADGKTLASGSDDRTIRLWDVKTGKPKATLEGHTWGVYSVCFSPDGKTLASASGDKTVRLWDLASQKELAVLNGHTRLVHCVAFSRDGKTLASVSEKPQAGNEDTAIILWNVATRKFTTTLKGHTWHVHAVAFSPDGKTLASASGDYTVKFWDVTTRQNATLKGHVDCVSSVCFSPDGKTLASGGRDCTVRLWDVANRKELRVLKGHTSDVLSVTFRSDGKTLASEGTLLIPGWGKGAGIIMFWDTSPSE